MVNEGAIKRKWQQHRRETESILISAQSAGSTIGTRSKRHTLLAFAIETCIEFTPESAKITGLNASHLPFPKLANMVSNYATMVISSHIFPKLIPLLR